MRAKLVALAIVSVAAVLLVPSAASAKAPAPVDLTNQAACSVDCSVDLVGFTTAGGQTKAVLKVTNDLTGASQRITKAVTAQQGGTCTILDLTIPPIDLFLLGIRIQTDTIHIVITAQRGTLLGDLLCGLFFGPANPLTAALNQALRAGAVAPA